MDCMDALHTSYENHHILSFHSQFFILVEKCRTSSYVYTDVIFHPSLMEAVQFFVENIRSTNTSLLVGIRLAKSRWR